MQLRDYQIDLNNRIRQSWGAGNTNVLAVMPTGAGKTKTFTGMVKEQNVPTMVIAHRQELIAQISEALAEWRIQHKIIAPTAVQRFCVGRHIKLFGQSYTHGDTVMLSSVQTLLRRQETLRHLFGRVKLWTVDEAHHILPDNQWGKATELFPKAVGLGVTATPTRCDGKGLNGVFSDMIVGPTMRDLINANFLTEYRIFCPPVTINLDSVRTSKSSGEYIQTELRDATHQSAIVGDVVSHYLRIAAGKRGLTFGVDRQSAKDMCQAYQQAGVPALYVDGETPDNQRADALDSLKRGDTKVICNVDLFGEGMDCPALDLVQMARPTQSYGLYVQQFGRALRTAQGKDRALIIDHVGNVVKHGLPDRTKTWTLEGRTARQKDPDAIPMTVCEMCLTPRERFIPNCTVCGHKNEPQERSSPAMVDGDLTELDPHVLEQMRANVIAMDSQASIPLGAGPNLVGRRKRDHQQLLIAQKQLRETIATWAGIYKYGHGAQDNEINRRFYLKFGTDILSAQSLNRAKSDELAEAIRKEMT